MSSKKRIIYLEDAKEALTGWETDPTDEEIEYTLDNLSTVDAMEVVHARWTPYKISNAFTHSCSVCHCDVNDKTPYCPYCGAKMDGGNEDV